MQFLSHFTAIFLEQGCDFKRTRNAHRLCDFSATSQYVFFAGNHAIFYQVSNMFENSLQDKLQTTLPAEGSFGRNCTCNARTRCNFGPQRMKKWCCMLQQKWTRNVARKRYSSATRVGARILSLLRYNFRNLEGKYCLL